MIGNFVATAPRSADGDDWEAFDALPRRIREALVGFVYDADARSVAAILDGESAHPGIAQVRTLLVLQEEEEFEIEEFSHQYEKQFGFPTPHVAARASVMRGTPNA